MLTCSRAPVRKHHQPPQLSGLGLLHSCISWLQQFRLEDFTHRLSQQIAVHETVYSVCGYHNIVNMQGGCGLETTLQVGEATLSA